MPVRVARAFPSPGPEEAIGQAGLWAAAYDLPASPGMLFAIFGIYQERKEGLPVLYHKPVCQLPPVWPGRSGRPQFMERRVADEVCR